MHHLPLLKNYGIRDVLMINKSGQTTLIILLLALVIGLIAHHLDLHPAVGAYMAGLILKKEYFHVDEAMQTQAYEQAKHVVDNVAFTWIGPVFFVTLGTKLVIDYDIVISVLPETLVMLSGLLVGQVLSAMLAARYTGHFEWNESVMIGIGMLGRAELAFVVLDIGYVQHSIITTEAFYTLMFTAFWLNVSVPLLIRFWKPYFMKKRGVP
jgi:Kef-type K+ transport system membrane component KefB